MSKWNSVDGARWRWSWPALGSVAVLLLALLAGCGQAKGDAAADGAKAGGAPAAHGGGSGQGGGRAGGGRPGGHGGPPSGPQAERGVPVEVAPVERREIGSFFETNGTLEAENEIDLVARSSGPITHLAAEEGQRVRRGQLLARLDDREARAQLSVAEIQLAEARQAYDRGKALRDDELISAETFEQSRTRFEAALGDVERLRVQLDYTEIKAPFSGLVVARYVKFAEHVSGGTPLFRLSDFDPLLCPIQVPERELRRLRVGQTASLEVVAWAGQRFAAQVLRLSPVVDAATGTVKVTLQVEGGGQLRPGMFASVYLEMESRPNALVIPKAALALDSLGDTVYVAEDGVAVRRAVELGFRSDDRVEVLAGLSEGESVVVVGQDGLSEGTPLEVLASASTGEAAAPAAGRQRAGREEGRGVGRGAGPPGEAGRPSAEQIEAIKARMRERGLSEQQIEERLARRRQRAADGGS